MVENVEFSEEKKDGAVDCAFENPSVFTPTVDIELTMFVYKKKYEELTHRKGRKKTTLRLPSIATSMYAALTLTGGDIQKLTTNSADLEKGAKGDIECPRSNK